MERWERKWVERSKLLVLYESCRRNVEREEIWQKQLADRIQEIELLCTDFRRVTDAFQDDCSCFSFGKVEDRKFSVEIVCRFNR